LDNMRCMRGRGPDAHDLRKDGEATPLLKVLKLEAGESMELLIDVRGDGIETFRRTTPIVAMRKVAF
jgi:hypothetical protein